jgi:hypothetical protein
LEQTNQQPIRCIQLDAKTVSPPYLHQNRINTAFAASTFELHRLPYRVFVAGKLSP